jgi:hypothetical protein
MQIRSLAQHPEVGGESKVGCDDVENLAPDGITGHDRAVEEDKVVPEEPRLLRTKERIRFLCMVTRPHDKDWNDEKMKRERIKHIRDEHRPTIERVLIAFLKTRS